MASDLGYCDHEDANNFPVGVYISKHTPEKLIHINLLSNETVNEFELEQEDLL